ncbi:MAG: TadG family pilus assembly protein [Myxococcota bacterium]
MGPPRRGNYTIFMGLVVLALLGFAALAIDSTMITMAELQAQATADAASHAALVMYRNSEDADRTADATAAAHHIVSRNSVALGTANLDGVEYGGFRFDTRTFCPGGCSGLGHINAVRVSLSRENTNAINLVLAPLFGIYTHDVRAEAVTSQQQRAIMLIQDWSGSMFTGKVPQAIDNSREATWGFYQYLSDHPQDGDMLGLAGYAQLGVLEDGFGTEFPTDPSWAQLTVNEGAGNKAYLEEKIRGICNSEDGCPDPDPFGISTAADHHPLEDDIGACTNPEIAIRQAMHQLTTKTDITFFRGIVLFSDGVFNCNTDGSWNSGQANDRAIDAVDEAWNVHGINVWTILLSSGGSVNPSAMANLVRGAGFAQVGNDQTELLNMYLEVARSLPTALVK